MYTDICPVARYFAIKTNICILSLPLCTKARFNVMICQSTICTSHTSLLLRVINLTLLRKICLWWLLRKVCVLVVVKLPESFLVFADTIGVGNV
jgi:hypothetical protein